MKKYTVILALSLSLTSCELLKYVVVSDTYEPTTNVEIIHTGQDLPKDIIRLGSITIDGQNSLVFSKDECSYEKCMQELILEAKKVGADIVYITSITSPNQGLIVIPMGMTFAYGVSGSSCYTIVADVYKRGENKTENSSIQ